MKAAQLLKLVESLHEFMIGETMKRLTKDLNLAFAERGREEGALPTDLWKKPVILSYDKLLTERIRLTNLTYNLTVKICEEIKCKYYRYMKSPDGIPRSRG